MLNGLNTLSSRAGEQDAREEARKRLESMLLGRPAALSAATHELLPNPIA